MKRRGLLIASGVSVATGRIRIPPGVRPCCASNSSRWYPSLITSSGERVLGCTIPSGRAPLTAARSARASGVSSELMRTQNCDFGRLGCAARNLLTRWRAAAFSVGATESSRSRMTISAALFSHFASFRSLSPGTNSSDRALTPAASGASAPTVCSSPPVRHVG